MIVTKENERLYFNSWMYNASQIMTELVKIVKNNGGRVKPLHTAVISNRSIDEIIKECDKSIARLSSSTVIESETCKTAIAKYQDKIAEMTAIDNSPILVTHTSYINFILDDMYYYYQIDDNPFFDFYYQKTPVENNKYSKDACLMEDEKEWLFDCFLKCGCSKADIVEAANLIFNMLVNAKNSPVRVDSHKERVANTYNGGYHYETIMEKERIGEIDF